MPRYNMPPGPGRPKGSKNKIDLKFSSLKEDYLEAYKRRGGVAFLMNLTPELFLRGLGKLLPQEVKADITGSLTHTINIIDYSTVGKFKKGGNKCTK